MTTLCVRLALWDEVDRLAKVIAGAFFDLEVSEWLIPDPGWRSAIYHRFFRLAYLEPGLRTGAVYCTADELACAVWLPVGQPCTEPVPDEAALEEVTGPYFKHFAEFERLLATAHEPYRSTPHDFLGVIGAHPAVWRQGSARALMAAHLRRLDTIGRPSYLEAASAPLVDVWHRFGYRRTDEIVVLPNGHELYPMWREPGPVPGGERG